MENNYFINKSIIFEPPEKFESSIESAPRERKRYANGKSFKGESL